MFQCVAIFSSILSPQRGLNVEIECKGNLYFSFKQKNDEKLFLVIVCNLKTQKLNHSFGVVRKK